MQYVGSMLVHNQLYLWSCVDHMEYVRVGVDVNDSLQQLLILCRATSKSHQGLTAPTQGRLQGEVV